ncbi:TonB-dependent receptor plug domain-containing protein [Pseudoduganella sp. RAF53_2]|uniref:TonB-dependent receptor plug domain-containing protein n=1 Tax=unclassified Pseudoduganella TaxID=2637179 RepID=UPI003F9C7C75
MKTAALAITLAFGAADLALAQQAANQPTTTVYVTGSNLKRTAKETTSVVQVITAQDIKDTGATSVQDLLKFIPAMGSDGNFDSSDGGFARGASTASLRGLTSTSTLILLNGRRMTPGAYADPNNGNSTMYDLNSIPVSAIERVEVLKEGASAIYGSDAIAGVINFITKTSYKGVEVSARYSGNDDNEFRRKGFSLLAGKGDLDTDGYTVFATLDVQKRDRTARIDAKDVEWDLYKTLNGRFATPYGSTVSASPVFYRESAPGSKNFGVTQATRDQRLVISLNCDPSRQLVGSRTMGLSASSVFIDRKFCNYDLPSTTEAQSAGKDYNFLSHGELKLGGDFQAYSELSYNRTERDYTGAPRTLAQSQTTNFTADGVGDPFQVILPIGHPDNPFPNARASVGYRFENLRGGNRNVNDNLRALVGVRGSLGGWDIDSALLWNEAHRKDTSYGQLYLPTLRKLNTGTTLAQLAADPTLGRDVTSDNKASITQLDFKANREFGQLPGGAMGVALGGEFRQEKIDLTPDDLVATGNILGLANTVLHGRRNVKSAFAEFRAPVLKSVELSAAGRIDKYDGLETNFVPQLGAKWTPVESFSVRASYSRGFRAPALNQTTPGGAQFFLQNLYDPKRCNTDEETPRPGATEQDCNKSAAGTGGANPDLKPEKSRSYSFGFVLAPASNIGMTIDWYRIRKEGEVILGSAFDALKNEDKNPGNVVRDTNPVNFVTDVNGKPIPGTGPLLMVREPWLNQGATETSGIDFDGSMRNSLGAYGALSTKLSATYVISYKIAQNPGDIEHNTVGHDPGLWDWNLSNNTRIPRFKFNLSSSWSFGDHAVNASVNYVGPISLMRGYNGDVTYAQPFCHYGTRKPTDAEQNRDTTTPLYEEYFPDCAIKSWTTAGLGYTYTGFKNVTLSLNIKNLFDKAAPYAPSQGVNTSATPLPGYLEGLHDNKGRYFTATARYVF